MCEGFDATEKVFSYKMDSSYYLRQDQVTISNVNQV